MSSHDPRVTLRQLAGFADEALSLVAGQSLPSLLADPVRTRAFERVMELVGESAKRIPEELRALYPAIPWRQITGMRDIISHAYEDLAYEVLWGAVQRDLPKLKENIASLLKKLEAENS